MKNARYYIGPMSLNVVDAVINHSSKFPVGLIPSRRQVDYDSGYVNNWNTSTFTEYVRSCSLNVSLCRDHGGPLQGSKEDNGLSSILQDAENFDLIHIDPFKQEKDMHKAALITVELIQQAHKKNPSVFYEVGTEEAIRKYEPEELQQFLSDVRFKLKDKEYQQIKYAVVQSGTGLDLAARKNTGEFNQKRLEKFVLTCKLFGLLSKEHNGDYLIQHRQLAPRFDVGLNAINIAPEFGQIETEWYINSCKKDEKTYDTLFNICYESGKWKKWVNHHNENQLTKESYMWMTTHYLLADLKFNQHIKSLFPTADSEIKQMVSQRLDSLYEQTKNYCF